MIGTLIGLGIAAVGFLFGNAALIIFGFIIAVLLTVFEQRTKAKQHVEKHMEAVPVPTEAKTKHILLSAEPPANPETMYAGDVLETAKKYETREQRMVSSPFLEKIFIGLPVRMGKLFKK